MVDTPYALLQSTHNNDAQVVCTMSAQDILPLLEEQDMYYCMSVHKCIEF